MCTPTRKKRFQPPLAPAVSKAERLVRIQQQQHTTISRNLAPFQEWVEAHSSTLPTCCTLLELVQRVNSFTASDVETVAVVTYLINSGRVRLCGTFAGAKILFSQKRARRNRRRAADHRRSKRNDE